ncbi:helix-turn-helix domain-containing protein [Deinococcus xianganensis]|uniref:Helix-turn-helix domain-containing protein n=1 Tax=Deinococcus xianganensis TaxID=1507289 RepID=A0A6I4YE12_9DEIO|nr:helix-turn-helix domain-containing protein [Deinococcus xianganensis]MXV19168.1 helix-turn-helix domain-containing protein [Deinococcus xianganensis]
MLVDTNEAARRLGCAPRTIRHYIATGILPAVRLGRRRWRIESHDLAQLLKPTERIQI